MDEQPGKVMDEAQVIADSAPVPQPMRSHFSSRETLDREMREVKDEVLRMGSLVAAQITAALEALVAHDAEAATATIVADGRINRRSATSPR